MIRRLLQSQTWQPFARALARRAKTTTPPSGGQQRVEPLEDRVAPATLTWVGDLDSNWNSGTSGVDTNWDTNTLPAPGDTLIFAGAGIGTLNNDTTPGNSYILQFTAGGYTLTGNSITLSLAGADIISTTGANTVATNLTLSGTNPEIHVSSGTVTLSGNLSGGSEFWKGGSGTVVLSGTNTHTNSNVIVAGTLEISDFAQLGSGNLFIGQGGTDGTIRYTGGSTSTSKIGAFALQAAGTGNTIEVTNAATTLSITAALGNTGEGKGYTKAGPGTLSITVDATHTGPVTVAAGSLVVGNGATAGSLTASGTASVVVNGELAVNRSDTFFINNPISGTGKLVQAGTGTLVLTGSNSYSGNTEINAGTLQIGNGGTTGTLGSGNVLNNATLVFNRSDAITVANNISGTGAVTKNNTNTVTFTANNSYTGATNVNAGTLALGNGGMTGLAGTGTINLTGKLLINRTDAPTISNPLTLVASGNRFVEVASGTTATLSGQITGSGEFWKDGAGTLVVTNTANNHTGSNVIVAGTLEIANFSVLGTANVFIGQGGGVTTLKYTGGSASTSKLAAFALQGAGTNSTIEVTNSAATLTLTAALGNDVSVKGFTKTGAGTLELAGNNTYNGGTVIRSGTVIGSHNNAFGAGGTITLNDAGTGVSDTSLLLANSVDITNPVTVSNNGTGISTIGASGSGIPGNATTMGGTITLNKATTWSAPTGLDRLALEGQITGAGAVTVSGGSRVTLSNTANNFTGDISVTGAGTILQASVNSAAEVIPNALNVDLGAGTFLYLAATAGGTETINNLTGSGTVTRNIAGTQTLAIGSANGSGAFSGLIQNGSGVVALNKLGTGTAIFSTANTYSGGLTITAGTAAISAAAGLSTPGGNVAGFGTGTVTVNSGATAWIHGSATSFGTIANPWTLNGGTLHVEDGATTFSGAVNMAAASAMQGRNNDVLTFSNTISGSGALTLQRSPSGTTEFPVFLLSGSNNMTGALQVNANAILRLGNANALSATSAGTTIASGGVLDLNGQTIGAEPLTVSGSGISSGGAIINGSGTAASFGGNITLAAATSIGGTNSFTLSGVISGANDLTKIGTGTVTLSGANTYTGATTISAGVIVASNGSALGTTAGTTTISSGAALHLTGGITLGEALTVSGTGISTTGVIRSLSGSNTLSGLVTQAAASRIQANSGSTLTLDVASGNAITGTFALTFGGAGNIAVNDPIAIGTSNLIRGSASGDTGVTTLSGVNTYTGGTVISVGTLRLGAADVISNSSAVTLGNTLGVAATFDLNNFNETVASIANVGGATTFGTIALGSGTLTFGNATATTYSGSISGTGSLVKAGSATATFTAASTFSGGTTINAGKLLITHNTALGTGGVTVANTGPNGQALILGAAGLNVSNPLTIAGGASAGEGALHYNQATGSVTYTGAITLTNAPDAGGHFGTAGGELILTGSLTASPSSVAVNVCSGTVTLQNSSASYTQMLVAGGTAKLGANNVIPTGATLNLGTATMAGTLDLNNFNQELAGIAGGTTATSRVVDSTNDATFPTLTINNSSAVTFGSATAVLGNTGQNGFNLAKLGTGTLTLAGTHTLSGTIDVSAGQLLINGSIGIGGAVTVDGGVLGGTGTLNRSVTVNTGGSITGGTDGGVGTLSLTNLTFNGGTFKADIVGAVADKLSVSDTLNYNGGTQGAFTLNNAAAGVTDGQVLLLIEKTSVGAPSGADLTGAAPGGTVTLASKTARYGYLSGTDANDFALTVDSTAPLVFTGTAGDDDIEIRRVLVTGNDYIQTLLGGVIQDSRPTAGIVGITINAGNGDDELFVNYGASGGIYTFDITYNGQGQTTSPNGDTLRIGGATVTTVTHTFTSNSDGSVAIVDGFGTRTVTYTGLEPIIDNLDAVNRVFTFTGAAETVTLSDDVGATMTIDSTLGESVTFANPTSSLTVNLTNGNDVFTVNSMDAAYAGSLTVTSDGGDTVTLAAGLPTLASASISASTINLNSLTTVGTQTFTGAVALQSNTALTTTNADITFSSTIDGITAATQSLTLNAGSGAISLGGAIGSTVSLANFTTISGSAALALPAITLGGNLNVATTAGAISQTGAQTIGGTASYTAGAATITLTNASNNFTGAVSLSNSGANNVAINDVNALQLGTVTVGTGTLGITAIGITQTGSLTQAAGAGAVTISGGAGVVLLNNAANDFTGAVTVTNGGANNVALTDSNALQIGGMTVGTGTLTLTAANGITQTGAITQAAGAGLVTLSGAAGAIVLNAGNDFTGIIDASTTGAAGITLNDTAGGLTLGTVTTIDGAISINVIAGALVANTVIAGGASRDITLTTTTSGNISVGNVTAVGDTIIINSAAAIQELGADAAADITAANLSLTAVSGIGTAGAIETNITTLNATTINSNVSLNEEDDLAVGLVDAGIGNVTLVLGGAGELTDANLGSNNFVANVLTLTAPGGITDIETDVAILTATTTNADIDIDEANDLALNLVNAGTGNVTLNVGGALTDNNAALNNITATNLTLTSVTGINVDTQVTTILNADASGTGDITINDLSGGLNVTSATTAGGDITITAAGGDLAVTNAASSADITLQTITSGDVLLGEVTAVNLATVISAGRVDELPAADAAADLLAAIASITANAGIGTNSGGALETEVSVLSGSTATGGIFIDNLGALNVTSLTVITAGNIVLNNYGDDDGSTVTVIGDLTISGAITTPGNITITAHEIDDNLDTPPPFTNNLTISGTGSINGNLVTLRAGDDVTIATGGMVTSTGLMTIFAGFADLDGQGLAIINGTINPGGGLNITSLGDILLGVINAPSQAVTLTSLAGSILDNNDNITPNSTPAVGVITDIVAGSLTLNAAISIGEDTDAIEMNIGTLTAAIVGDGGIWLWNRSALTVGNVTSTGAAAADEIAITSEGSMTINGAILQDSGAPVTFFAAGAASNLLLNGSVTTSDSGGVHGGNITLNAGNLVQLGGAAVITVIGEANVSLNAGYPDGNGLLPNNPNADLTISGALNLGDANLFLTAPRHVILNGANADITTTGSFNIHADRDASAVGTGGSFIQNNLDSTVLASYVEIIASDVQLAGTIDSGVGDIIVRPSVSGLAATTSHIFLNSAGVGLNLNLTDLLALRSLGGLITLGETSNGGMMTIGGLGTVGLGLIDANYAFIAGTINFDNGVVLADDRTLTLQNNLPNGMITPSGAGIIDVTIGGAAGTLVVISQDNATLSTLVSNLGSATEPSSVTVGTFTLNNNNRDLNVAGTLSADVINLTTGTATLTISENVAASPANDGNITIIADGLALNADIEGGGILHIRGNLATTTIGLGDSAPGTLNLNVAEIARIQDGFAEIRFGFFDASLNANRQIGLVTIVTPDATPVVFYDPVRFTSSTTAGDIVIEDGHLDGLDNASFQIIARKLTFTADPATTLTGITTDGQLIDVRANVQLDADTEWLSNGGNINSFGTIDGNQNFTIDAATGDIVLNGSITPVPSGTSVGGTVALASITITGDQVDLRPNIATTGDQTFTAATQLLLRGGAFTAYDPAGDITFNGPTIVNRNTFITGKGGAITFNGTVDSGVGGTGAFTIEASNGVVAFTNDVGGTLPLAYVRIESAGQIILGDDAGDTFTVANELKLVTDELDMDGTVLVPGGALLIRAASTATAVEIGGAESLAPNVLSLSDDDIAALGDGFGSITITRTLGTAPISIVSNVNFTDPLIISQNSRAGGGIFINAEINGSDNASLTFRAPAVHIDGVISTNGGGAVDIENGVAVATPTIIDTSIGGGDVTLRNLFRSAAGGENVQILAGTGDIIIDAKVGNLPLAPEIGTFTLTSSGDTRIHKVFIAEGLVVDGGGTTFLKSRITTTSMDGQDYHDPVQLIGNLEVRSTDSNGLIRFRSTVDSNIATPTKYHALSVSNSAAVAGDFVVQLDGHLGSTQRLGAFTVKTRGDVIVGGDVFANTIRVRAGNFSVQNLNADGPVGSGVITLAGAGTYLGALDAKRLALYSRGDVNNSDAWTVTGTTTILARSFNVSLTGPGNSFGDITIIANNATIEEDGNLTIRKAKISGVLDLKTNAGGNILQGTGRLQANRLVLDSAAGIVINNDARVNELGSIEALNDIEVRLSPTRNVMLDGPITSTAGNVILAANTNVAINYRNAGSFITGGNSVNITAAGFWIVYSNYAEVLADGTNLATDLVGLVDTIAGQPHPYVDEGLISTNTLLYVAIRR